MLDAKLTRYAWLSIFTALVTMALKLIAWKLTGSVGLLSDALESLVNLGGATMALLMLRVAMLPRDEHHAYGHSKAEYFSSGFEGMLILVAGAAILYTAIPSLWHPKVLEQATLGLMVSALASVMNLVVAQILLRAGKKNRSITLEADAHHLMTDVWTSAAIIVGVGLVALTGFTILDPVMAVLMACNILWTGFRLMRESVHGLMDGAWDDDDIKQLNIVLDGYRTEQTQFHDIRTRRAAANRFVSFHMLVPGEWSVQRAHELAEKIEARLEQDIPGAVAISHLEPIEDPASYADVTHSH